MDFSVHSTIYPTSINGENKQRNWPCLLRKAVLIFSSIGFHEQSINPKAYSFDECDLEKKKNLFNILFHCLFRILNYNNIKNGRKRRTISNISFGNFDHIVGSIMKSARENFQHIKINKIFKYEEG